MSMTAASTPSPRSITAEIERITPAVAEDLLEANSVNRGLRQQTVEAYRRDMEQGRWIMTGEPIQFSRTGQLLNGQHRMTALAGSTVETGIDFLVVHGLPDLAQQAMDQGAPRGVADALRIAHGHQKNVSIVAAVARWMVAHPDPGVPNMVADLKKKVSSAESVEAFRLNPDIPYAAERAASMKMAIPGSPSAVAYAYLHINRVDPGACNEFFGAMTDLSFNLTGDPRKAALRRLQSVAMDPGSRGHHSTTVVVISVLTRAWNSWRRGEQVNSIMGRNNKGLPIEPVRPI